MQRHHFVAGNGRSIRHNRLARELSLFLARLMQDLFWDPVVRAKIARGLLPDAEEAEAASRHLDAILVAARGAFELEPPDPDARFGLPTGWGQRVL